MKKERAITNQEWEDWDWIDVSTGDEAGLFERGAPKMKNDPNGSHWIEHLIKGDEPQWIEARTFEDKT